MSKGNDTNNLSEEFKQKVILVLDDNDKKFETNWSENQAKLLKLDESTKSLSEKYFASDEW